MITKNGFLSGEKREKMSLKVALLNGKNGSVVKKCYNMNKGGVTEVLVYNIYSYELLLNITE